MFQSSNWSIVNSFLVQLQQSFGRIHRDASAINIDMRRDVDRQRDQDLAVPTVDDEDACASAPLDAGNLSDPLASNRLHHATDQLMLVVGSLRQRLQRLFWNPQF